MADLVYWTFSEIPSEMIDILVKDLKKYDLSKLITYISQDRENIQGFTVFEYVEMGRFPYQNFYGKYDNNSQKFINESLKLVNLFKSVYSSLVFVINNSASDVITIC